MKEKKTAAQLAAMIEGRLTMQGSVGVIREGSSWVAGAAVWGVENAAEAERQAKQIAAELREKYELIDD